MTDIMGVYVVALMVALFFGGALIGYQWGAKDAEVRSTALNKLLREQELDMLIRGITEENAHREI